MLTASPPLTRPFWYRAWTIFTVSYATWVVVLYSTSYTATVQGVMDEFGVSSRAVATLGLTTYLLGLAAGSVVVAPMSELYGRRVVYLVCLSVFVVLIVPSGLARSLTDMVVVRFFAYVVLYLAVPPFFLLPPKISHPYVSPMLIPSAAMILARCSEQP